MKTHRFALAFPVAVALAACQPGAAEYTKTEAPTDLRVDNATTQVSLAFPRGSWRLPPRELARLDGLVRSGAIRPDDHVTISMGAAPALAGSRQVAIADELLRFGIVADAGLLAGVPPDHAIITVGRYLVTLPNCPNWSQKPFSDWTNETSSNYGCADQTNLALQVASPADLVSGRTLGPADAGPAVRAVDRYLTDRVTLPVPVAGATALAAAPATGVPAAPAGP